jgi:pimeloyl-ACP methyl ester carboxylesterase
MQERGVLLSEITTRPLPPDIVAYLTAGVRHCDAEPLIENARRHGWPLDPAQVRCPVRVLWGLQDKLLPWPQAAERYRRSLDAEWIELDGVGHAPQLDVPLETAQLILGFTAM